jgi:hypothetical protein
VRAGQRQTGMGDEGLVGLGDDEFDRLHGLTSRAKIRYPRLYALQAVKQGRTAIPSAPRSRIPDCHKSHVGARRGCVDESKSLIECFHRKHPSMPPTAKGGTAPDHAARDAWRILRARYHMVTRSICISSQTSGVRSVQTSTP